MKWLNLFLLIMLMSIHVYSQNISYAKLPSQLQLFPRNSQDSALVEISGTVTMAGYDSIIIQIDTNSVSWKRLSQLLNYNGSNADFSFTPKIYADTVNFSFEVILKQNPTTEISDTTISQVVCGDVYFINGQSNAVDASNDPTNQWVRSFGTSQGSKATTNHNWYEATSKRYQEGAIGNWGLHLGVLIAANHGIPVCVIQQGEGGKKIPYFTTGIGGDTLPQYSNFDQLLYRASNAGVTDAVKAIFWWQGESDADSAAVGSYYRSHFVDSLYNGWLTYYPNIQKIYTTQIHPYGTYGDQVREIQRKIAEDSSKIEIITPHNIGGFDGIHFSDDGYKNYAAKLYRLVARDFYTIADPVDINPPNIQQAYFTDSNNDVLVLEFDNTNPLTFDPDTTIGPTTYFLKDHFYFHNTNGTIDTAFVNNITVFTNKLRLELENGSNADSISYLPAQYYNGSTTGYDGPWIKSSKNVAALTFYKFPINDLPGDDPLPVTLSIFAADYADGQVKLKWRTESEINNLGFNLLRKNSNENNYRQIASYEYIPALSGQGTTNKATDYEYFDDTVEKGESYFYILQDVDFGGRKTNHGPIEVKTSLNSVPGKFNLYQNFPNPFNPSTRIPFFIPEEQFVELAIFDILGRKVLTLLSDRKNPGYYEIDFDGTDFKSGQYYYQLETDNFSAVKRMLIIK